MEEQVLVFFSPHAEISLFNLRSLAPLFVAGLLSGFWHGNLLLVACPHCISILNLYSVDFLILVKNGIDFLNMHII